MLDSQNFSLLYNAVYIFMALIALMMTIRIDAGRSNTSMLKFSRTFSIIFTVILVLLIGLRPLSVGADTVSYENLWNVRELSDYKNDLLFAYIIHIIKSLGLSYRFFLFIISTIFFVTISFAYKKISNFNNTNLFLLLFSFFSFFFCLSLSTNVIQQGVSLAFLLLGYAYYNQTNTQKNVIVCLIIAVGVHATSLIPVSLYLIALIFNKIKLKYYYFFYILGMVLSYFGYSIKNISPFLYTYFDFDNRIGYIEAEVSHYAVGFKPQFAVFNSIFLVIFTWLHRAYKDKKYELLLKYYMLASFVFFMAFQIIFSDRWGLFSWIAIPVLFSPVFSIENRKQKLHTISVLFLMLIFIFFNVLYK